VLTTVEMELGIQAGLGTQAMEPKAIEVRPSKPQKYSNIWSVSIRVSSDEQGKNTEVYLIIIIFLLMISLAGK